MQNKFFPLNVDTAASELSKLKIIGSFITLAKIIMYKDVVNSCNDNYRKFTGEVKGEIVFCNKQWNHFGAGLVS